MKPAKLYAKFFLSFLAVLVIAEVLILALFIVTAGRAFKERYMQYTSAKILVAKEVIEDKLAALPRTAPQNNRGLKDFLAFWGRTYEAEFWFTAPGGSTVIKSMDGPSITPILGKHPEHVIEDGRVSVRYIQGHDMAMVASVSIATPEGARGAVHFGFRKLAPEGPLWIFALGLLAVGVLIALMIIPVSRLITRPIAKLNASALRIAGGDLSHRVDLKSKDEIGQLGKSFNHMAEQVEEMIKGGKDLTANLSHELRTPLARIRIAEELLARYLESGEYGKTHKYLLGIREDIEELDRLIGRILELSRLDLHQEPFGKEEINLGDMLNDLIERFAPVVEQKGLNLSSGLMPVRPVRGNAEALYSALSNVVDNALKFTPRGGRVEVRLEDREGQVRLMISNPSQPMSQECLARIFEPFYCADETPNSGTGLGLALAKKVMERHGGSVLVSQSQGRFVLQLTLPINDRSAPPV